MKKQLLLCLITMLCAWHADAARNTYELSPATCTKGTTADTEATTLWEFTNGFTIMPAGGYKYQPVASASGIKYTPGKQFTINIPSGVEVRRIQFSGYDNYADADSYIAELNGKTLDESQYVFPQKDASGNTTSKSYTITFDEAVSGSLTFTAAGKQVVWRIVLFDFVPGGDTKPNTYPGFNETLDRGLIALPARSGKGQFVSWRLLGTDDDATTFDLLRDGTTIATDLSDVTSYVDAQGTASSEYQVVVKQDGDIVETTPPTKPWADVFATLPLQRPSDIYTPNDCSVGDVDGDGQYEIFLKWDPNTSQDNSNSGKTDKVFIDCYRLDGTLLWRVDLGYNIRAGAHYTQFLVYDFDGDGKAEMICKTAPGSKDGQGRYVTAAATDASISGASDNTTSYRNSKGYILSGPEYLTVFNGETGAAVHTVYYNPNRAGTVGGAPSGSDNAIWGDTYGGRCDRFLAAVAFLDGPQKRPSAVMCRGYYTRAYVWAVDFDGEELSTKWLHGSVSGTKVELTDADGNVSTYNYGKGTSGSGSATMYGNGNHNLSVADVDGDGCDEILYGSAAVDNDGMLLYGTGFGHGDAIHLSDLDPDRPGLELFQVHEEKGTYSWDIHDAATGEIIYKGGNKGVDNGRGLAAQLSADQRGFFFCSSDEREQRSAVTGEVASEKHTSVNFRIYWDGDLQDELLDGHYNEDIGYSDQVRIDSWNGNGTSRILTLERSLCNTTKLTPNLQADILGDWREEIVVWDHNSPTELYIYSTNFPTEYRVPTLMHDHVYRMGVAWQQTAYNQPPHLGYYLPDLFVEDDTPEEPVEPCDVIFSQDYEDETDASTWTSPNAQNLLSLETDDSQYIKYTGNTSMNSRSNYTLFSSGNNQVYRLEFDMALTAGNKDASEVAVMAEGYKNQNNSNFAATNSGANYLLDLTSTGAYSNTFVINGDADNTVELSSGAWYHIVLDVDGQTGNVAYAIKTRATGRTVVSGTYALPSGTSYKTAGLYYLNGRYNGTGKFDNIAITKATDTTGIDTTLAAQDEANGDDAVFDLQGRRVGNAGATAAGRAQLRKGIYVKNGKKVVVR